MEKFTRYGTNHKPVCNMNLDNVFVISFHIVTKEDEGNVYKILEEKVTSEKIGIAKIYF